MKTFVYFLRLIRWPNLVFILLAEILFHCCIYKPLYPGSNFEVDLNFSLIALTYLFIAAAGYIINDYFDISMIKTIISPFFGGGSFEFYMQNKYGLKLIVNDKFTPLYNFWNQI